MSCVLWTKLVNLLNNVLLHVAKPLASVLHPISTNFLKFSLQKGCKININCKIILLTKCPTTRTLWCTEWLKIIKLSSSQYHDLWVTKSLFFIGDGHLTVRENSHTLNLLIVNMLHERIKCHWLLWITENCWFISQDLMLVHHMHNKKLTTYDN